MNILIVGSGGREHALAYTLKKSKHVDELFVLPGNGGLKEIATCIDGKVDDFETILKVVEEYKIGLTVVGGEIPLCLGLSDFLEERGHCVFGVNKKAARLEGSKAYAKKFMEKYNIPTATYVEVSSYDEGIASLHKFSYPLVIKADGLASGKGVVICNNRLEAIATLRSMLVEGCLKDACNTVVIEEFLEGFECSLLAFVDGTSIVPMVSAKDHKQVFDGNKGPNTGGMGSVSPNPFLKDDFEERVNEVVLQPFMKGLQQEGIDYRGVIFIGLMIQEDDIKVLEFNVRFGDPETQVIMLRLQSDLYEIMDACRKGCLKKEMVVFKEEQSACVVLTSKGYPKQYETGKRITGLDDVRDVEIFHAGTKLIDESYFTNGGRVLNVCATAPTLQEALHKVYDACDVIDFDGKQFRHDIGKA